MRIRPARPEDVLAAEVDGTAHVEQVTVDPAWQSRGVGTALLAAVAGWGATAGLAARPNAGSTRSAVAS